MSFPNTSSSTYSSSSSTSTLSSSSSSTSISSTSSSTSYVISAQLEKIQAVIEASNRLEQILTCPVMHIPFSLKGEYSPMELPCRHVISAIAASSILKTNKLCPLCRESFTKAIPSFILKQILETKILETTTDLNSKLNSLTPSPK